MPGVSSLRKVTSGLGSRTAAKFATYHTLTSMVATSTGVQIVTPAMLSVVTVSVTTDANDIIILPEPIPGRIVVIMNGTTGYELRSNAPATVGINGGTGASAESAIPASTTAILICETATAWKGLQIHGTAGTLAKVDAAA